MNNYLKILIMAYTDLLDSAYLASKKIYRLCQESNSDKAIKEIENRERLFNVIEYNHKKLESKIVQHYQESKDPTLLLIAKAWESDYESWLNLILDYDNKIVEYLEQSKESVTKEIATVFKTKETFKGYNLSSIRK